MCYNNKSSTEVTLWCYCLPADVVNFIAAVYSKHQAAANAYVWHNPAKRLPICEHNVNMCCSWSALRSIIKKYFKSKNQRSR